MSEKYLNDETPDVFTEVPKTSSDNSVSLIDSNEFAQLTDADQHLAQMGYKPVLKREFSMFSAFSFAVSISGLFATVATTFSYPLIAGGAASVIWTWVISGIGCMCISLSVAELVSAYPTAGGMYFTCSYVAPKKYMALISWMDGWLNFLGQIAGIASSDYGAAQLLLAAVSMGSDFTYVPTTQHTVAVMAGILLFHGIINSMSTKFLEKVTNGYVILHIGVLVSGCIALLVMQDDKHDAKYVFTNVESSSGWNPIGFSFLFGFLSVSWSMTDSDATAHVCEEMTEPEKKAPWAIAYAMSFTYFVGILLNIVLVFCMGDPAEILASPVDQPVAQIFYNVLGKKGGIFYTVMAFFIMNFVAITAIHACSRTVWAFSRDQMLPFSRVWYRINKFSGVPVNSVWLTVISCILINLIALGSYTTIAAIFNVCAIAIDWSYCIPILCKIFGGNFQPGPWNLGRASIFVNSWACLWTLFVSIIFVLPTVRPVTADSMNYAAVFFVGIGVFAAVYWYVAGRKYYTGPRKNTQVVDGLKQNPGATTTERLFTE
ncbi:Uga4p [Sugiyamaella lignohabitans]|uniref:Uga4p n=1 Tax=Sugiyamaella lignohabitans TaxID=796027 RepID=A0A167CAA2_9ASCO|nr:Uga4p [Sugiyamaella lignohabitans]ANB11423.1 Uga4p [Sugiyamaella lignohabitans]